MVVICSRCVNGEATISSDYQLNWRKLQQVGLNAYEARSYLVLMGHPRFKALELAARAHVRTYARTRTHARARTHAHTRARSPPIE